MTDIDKLAREIAADAVAKKGSVLHGMILSGMCDDDNIVSGPHNAIAAARLGLEAGEQRGMKLQRERDAAIARSCGTGPCGDCCDTIAKAIEEQP